MTVFFNAFVGNAAVVYDFVAQSALMDNFWLWVAAIVFCMPVRRYVANAFERRLSGHVAVKNGVFMISRLAISVAMLVLSVALLVGATNNAFIYTRF